MGKWEGARLIDSIITDGLIIPKGGVDVVVGSTETLITRPGEEHILVLDVGGNANAVFNVIPGDYISRTFQGDFTGGVEELILVDTDHGFTSGDGPYMLTEGTTLPTGVDEATQYYVYVIDDDTFALYLTEAAAKLGLIGDRVDIETDGTADNEIAGMANNELGTVPAATTEDGYNAVPLRQGRHVFSAPSKMTVLGSGTTPALTYWWID